MAQEASQAAQETPTTPPYEPWKAQILELHRGPVAPKSFGTSRGSLSASWGSLKALLGLSWALLGFSQGSAGAMVEALYPRGRLGLEFFSKANARGKIR